MSTNFIVFFLQKTSSGEHVHHIIERTRFVTPRHKISFVMFLHKMLLVILSATIEEKIPMLKELLEDNIDSEDRNRMEQIIADLERLVRTTNYWNKISFCSSLTFFKSEILSISGKGIH